MEIVVGIVLCHDIVENFVSLFSVVHDFHFVFTSPDVCADFVLGVYKTITTL